MGTLNFAGGASLSGSGSNLTSSSGLNLGGNWVDAPVGTIIKRGSYNTGYGSGARTALSAASWNAINIDGTGQAGMNVGKVGAGDIISFDKISNKSHLEITVNFPYYVATGNSGFGVRCQASKDGGSNYVILGNLTNGSVSTWGGGGYGGNDAGVFNYTWSTYDNSTERSSWLATTGETQFWFQMYVYNTNDTVHMIDYDGTFAKEGTIQISEIITE